MKPQSKFHTYRLIGLWVSGSFWPLLFVCTFVAVLCAGPVLVLPLFGNVIGVIFTGFGVVLGPLIALASPAVVGFIYCIYVRNRFGELVQKELMTRFSKLYDGAVVEFTINDLTEHVHSGGN